MTEKFSFDTLPLIKYMTNEPTTILVSKIMYYAA